MIEADAAPGVGDDDDSLADRAEKLAEKVEGLTDEVKALNARSIRLAWVVAGAVVLLILGGMLVFQQQSTSSRLESVVQNALCPTFALLLGGFDPGTRAEGPARDQYIETFSSFRRSYDVLRCAGPLVPPRTN